jgi:DNA-binding response OmpR family regulator
LEELLARIQALVRRSYGVKSSSIQIGPLEIDTARRRASRQGEPIELTFREYALLEYLALRKGQVVSRREIEDHIYDDGAELTSNVVDSFVYRLRKKIESSQGPTLIHTRRGMGYVLEEPKT